MSRYHSSWVIRIFGCYYFKSWAAECDAADPPYMQNTQAAQGPETPGAPLLPKIFYILVSFWSLARGYENRNDHTF